ncbi:MAG: hypothetical protein AVDCRST_MAG93-379 [uncultured Chloroflexia bacterium]|uniref:Uncharacterized protein n=1 Tax=uncultured Chloroflexia bacterium TaxID=1672391 RepID=A0A6J4HC47_9CHLR|nr:MAG: hypothetical protein AVDCRST_MAG93-379 [uncultured Chloroflexia bacterium]
MPNFDRMPNLSVLIAATMHRWSNHEKCWRSRCIKQMIPYHSGASILPG